LQEGEIKRVGGSSSIKVDVRIIAATTKDLSQEVREGRFRDDLYFRLNVILLKLPPLRQRKDDIPLIVDRLIERLRIKLQLDMDGLEQEALEVIMNYSWPGNVRELENAIERAMVMAEGRQISANDLPADVRQIKESRAVNLLGNNLSIKQHSRAIEEELIRKALDVTDGNRTRAARLLEISHRALIYKIKEYGVG